MTREEAIKELYVLWERHKCYEGKDAIRYFMDGNYVEALDMAIQALEQEPCEDAVSRQTIIQTLNTMDRYVANSLILCDTDKKFPENEVFVVDDVYEEIVENLPPVQPMRKRGKWTRELIRNDKGGCIGAKMICSECGKDNEHDEYMDFCPKCGSDNREDGE